MIVVDSSVIAHCLLNSPMTRLAQRVWVKDPDWQVPVLWRSEMRSIFAGYLREGSLSAAREWRPVAPRTFIPTNCPDAGKALGVARYRSAAAGYDRNQLGADSSYRQWAYEHAHGYEGLDGA